MNANRAVKKTIGISRISLPPTRAFAIEAAPVSSSSSTVPSRAAQRIVSSAIGWCCQTWAGAYYQRVAGDAIEPCGMYPFDFARGAHPLVDEADAARRRSGLGDVLILR
jgi:hypothetical protein